MPGRALVLAFLIATLSLCFGMAAFAEKRVALVIGNSDYRNKPILSNPFKDTAGFGALLKNAGFDHVDIRHNLGNPELRRAIGDFAEHVQDADIAVIYYAGH